MIDALAAFLTLTSAQPAQAAVPGGDASPQPTRRGTMHSQFVFPDDIASALLPYAGCLMARDGIEVRRGFDPRPAGVARGADCTPYRREAERRADAMLQRLGGRSADERRAYIERTLVAMEAHHNELLF